MKSELDKIFEKELKKYRIKKIKIFNNEYPLYVFLEDEDLNLFEGFLYAEVKTKEELSNLKTKYRAPVSGYTTRISFILYNGHLLIKDYRRNKHITKTLNKINRTFLNKIRNVLSNPTEENFEKLFSRDDVVEEFYLLYKKTREYLLKNIKGIPDEHKRKNFVDNLMMQMLTLWYLQEKEFFNNDKNYFINMFKIIKKISFDEKPQQLSFFTKQIQQKLFKKFPTYYDFLRYFFEKISDGEEPIAQDPYIGKYVVIGPAVFLNKDTDQPQAVTIPDKCFYKEGLTEILITTPPKKLGKDIPLLNLFESRDWVEGDIDEYVLGALYEKLMTEDERKRTGSYYTPEEITTYICKNTIEPYLVDRINEKYKKNFKSIDELIENADKKIIISLFEELKNIKILDPAVGSAHFLESAINILAGTDSPKPVEGIYEKLVRKANELGIKKGLEIITADKDGKIITVDLMKIKDKEEFRLFVKFFIILSKNIYGVDINPSALKVARARLFLTLAKHFNVHKRTFIRFPNVHFNLREGNSLIGYVKLEKTKEKPVMLELFAKEKQALYITESIKVVSALQKYLPQTAKSLKINGDILKEIKELNKILSKKKIDWDEFEKVLRTKEKLTQILIASLNSRYARPINELLNRITELFNKKLDKKFAEEYNIDLEKLKNTKLIPSKRKMFHWIFEFPEVFFDRDGFDVVIGNPPYGRLKQIIEDKEEKYFLSEIYSNLYQYQVGNLNLYKLFLERSYNLLKSNGYFSMIFPSSFLGENDSKELRKLFFEECEVRTILQFPKKTKVFEGVVQDVSILVYQKGKTPDDYFFKIKTNIKPKEKNSIESIDYALISKKEMRYLSYDYTIPIFTNPKIDWEILKHISEFPKFDGLGVIGEGHLHESINKEFLSDNPEDEILIRRMRVGRYLLDLEKSDKWREAVFIKDKEKFLKLKPSVKDFLNLGNVIIGREILQIGEKKKLQFSLMIKPCICGNSVRYIIVTGKDANPLYLLALLNSSMLEWRFRIFSWTYHIKKYEIESLPIPRISQKEQELFIILAKYMLFLKQYQNYFAKDDKHLQYIIDYFDNLIDCLVYELYLGEVVKIPIKEFVESKIEDINLPENLLETDEKKRNEIFKKIEKVFQELENDKKLNENLYLIKLHPWVKTIYEALER